MSDNTLLLRALDERAKANDSEFDREIAEVIRELEAENKTAFESNVSIRLLWKQEKARLDALELELFEAKAEIALWQVYCLTFMSLLQKETP